MYSIDELIAIADSLDACGLHSEAETIDGMIEKLAAPTSGAIPSFVTRLKETFVSEIGDSGDRISLEYILEVIDSVAQNSGPFTGYKAGPEEVNRLKVMSQEPASKALHLLELQRSVKDIKSELDKENDPEKIKLLQRDLKSDQEDLDEILKKVEQWKSGKRDNDIASYDLFTKIYNSRGENIE